MQRLNLKFGIWDLFSPFLNRHRKGYPCGVRISDLVLRIFIISVWIFCLLVTVGFPQEGDVNFTLDVAGKTTDTPKALRNCGIDLSGRGFHHDPSWPQNLASPEALSQLQKDVFGRGGIFRLQFDLWDFVELAKNKEMQTKLLDNYAAVIKDIHSRGAITILDLYGTPAGLGKALDNRSSPWNIKAFKELIRGIIHHLSIEKGYNIWYEVWNAPDLEEFFLGQKQDYFRLYQAIAEVIKELETQTKQNIPLGGPSITWWFQNLEGNSLLYPERSLIYELIRFCSQRRLPLDFISWHAYSADPLAESEITIYKNTAVQLIRKWLSYFDLDPKIPLIISEWNYDIGLNFDPRRSLKSNVAASYIPSRLNNMARQGIDYQLFFSLEDFRNNKQGLVRNTGLFWFDPEYSKYEYEGGAKSMFNVICMLNMLGSQMFITPPLQENGFVDVIATRTEAGGFYLLLFNYIDPEIARSFLTRHLAELHPKHIRNLVNLIKSDKWNKILNKELVIKSLRINKRIKTKLQEAVALHQRGLQWQETPRNVNLSLVNLKEDYIYKKYIVDKSCGLNCPFQPKEEKEIVSTNTYKETLILEPYSVVLIALDKKPPTPKVEEPIKKDIEEEVSPVRNDISEGVKKEE